MLTLPTWRLGFLVTAVALLYGGGYCMQVPLENVLAAPNLQGRSDADDFKRFDEELRRSLADDLKGSVSFGEDPPQPPGPPELRHSLAGDLKGSISFAGDPPPPLGPLGGSVQLSSLQPALAQPPPAVAMPLDQASALLQQQPQRPRVALAPRLLQANLQPLSLLEEGSHPAAGPELAPPAPEASAPVSPPLAASLPSWLQSPPTGPALGPQAYTAAADASTADPPAQPSPGVWLQSVPTGQVLGPQASPWRPPMQRSAVQGAPQSLPEVMQRPVAGLAPAGPQAAAPGAAFSSAPGSNLAQASAQSEVERGIERAQRAASLVAKDAAVLSQELEALNNAFRGVVPVHPHRQQAELYAPQITDAQRNTLLQMQSEWPSPLAVLGDRANLPFMLLPEFRQTPNSSNKSNSTIAAEPIDATVASGGEVEDDAGTGGPAVLPAGTTSNSTGQTSLSPSEHKGGNIFTSYNIASDFWTLNHKLADFSTVIFWIILTVAITSCCGLCCVFRLRRANQGGRQGFV